MFSISLLKFISKEDEVFLYEFEEGVNYFVGNNATGKTELYSLFDYMFGNDIDIEKKEWYKNIKKIVMEFNKDSQVYICIRSMERDYNLIYSEEDESTKEVLTLQEYRGKLNMIFTTKKIYESLKLIMDENISYRTFTMFNFLGETGQGKITNFLDKSQDYKYFGKQNSILNYLFNDNFNEIRELQHKISELKDSIKNHEINEIKKEFVISEVRKNLKVLDIDKEFKIDNKHEIKHEISNILNLEKEKNYKKENKLISELEVSYNEIEEQIKKYKNQKKDLENLSNNFENKNKLLMKLNSLIESNDNYDYLVSPIKKIINDINDSISLSNFLINEETIKKLNHEKKLIKENILNQDKNFTIYSVEEKEAAVISLRTLLDYEVSNDSLLLEKKLLELKNLRKKYRSLVKEFDKDKIESFSENVTNYYRVASEQAEFVKLDFEKKGFNVEYDMLTNSLELTYFNNDKRDDIVVGSMARKTLLQLSGYVAFLELLIKNQNTPFIPILVIDHISKSFDDEAMRSVGSIIEKFYENVSKSNMQIFIVDNQKPEALNITVDSITELVDEKLNKSGSIPFYNSKG